MFIYIEELFKFHLKRVLLVVLAFVLVLVGVMTYFYMQAEKTPNIVNTTTKAVSEKAQQTKDAVVNSKAYKGTQATAHQAEYVAEDYVKSQMGGQDTPQAANKIIDKSVKESVGVKQGQSIFDNADGQNVVQQAAQQEQAQQPQQESGNKYIIN